MTVKLEDIAREANVSISTVSLALNNKQGVSKRKRQEIVKIAENMGYPLEEPEEEKAIRLIIYKRHGNVVSDTPFFAKLVEGIQRECRINNYDMTISHINHEEENIKGIIRNIKNDKTKGILLLATEMLEDDLKYFDSIKKPLVLLDSYFRFEDYDYVLINNTDAAAKATRKLIENGHQEIGYLHSSVHINNFYYRKKGFEDMLKKHSIDINQDYIYQLIPTMEDSYKDMKELLKSKDKSMPTAFFADNDIIAIGAMRALKEAEIKIPEELSIIGFDDMPFCEISNPRLSTVKVFKEELGGLAVKRLIEKIEGKDKTRHKLEVGTELVVRDSVVSIE